MNDAKRDRIRHGVLRSYYRRRAAAQIAPSELVELRRTGSVAPRLLPYVGQAMHEVEALTAALGGEKNVSEQRLLVIRDVARLGTLLAALVAHALQRDVLDLDEVAKITSLAAARGRLLAAIGVDRVATPVPDLAAYLAQRRANGDGGDAEGGLDADRAAETDPRDASADAPRQESKASGFGTASRPASDAGGTGS